MAQRMVLWVIGLITAFMTSFYMFRLWFLTFFGEYRGGTRDMHQNMLDRKSITDTRRMKVQR